MNNPEDPAAAAAACRFARLYIERDDFMEVPPKSSSAVARDEVRLRYAYLNCERVVKDTAGTVTELRAPMTGVAEWGHGAGA